MSLYFNFLNSNESLFYTLKKYIASLDQKYQNSQWLKK